MTTSIPLATATRAGLMSPGDKARLAAAAPLAAPTFTGPVRTANSTLDDGSGNAVVKGSLVAGGFVTIGLGQDGYFQARYTINTTYDACWRFDGRSLYLMRSAAGVGNAWDDARPFYWDTFGRVLTLGGTPNDTLSVGGPASFLVSPTAPTPAAGDASTKLATTGFVAAALAPPALQTLAQGPAGSTVQFGIAEQLVATASGTAVTAATPIPNRAIVFAVSSYVATAVTGPTSFGIGIAGNAGQFGSGLSTAKGAQNAGVIGPTAFYAATPLVLTAGGGTAFTGGAVRLAIHYALFGPPTS